MVYVVGYPTWWLDFCKYGSRRFQNRFEALPRVLGSPLAVQDDRGYHQTVLSTPFLGNRLPTLSESDPEQILLSEIWKSRNASKMVHRRILAANYDRLRWFPAMRGTVEPISCLGHVNWLVITLVSCFVSKFLLGRKLVSPNWGWESKIALDSIFWCVGTSQNREDFSLNPICLCE